MAGGKKVWEGKDVRRRCYLRGENESDKWGRAISCCSKEVKGGGWLKVRLWRKGRNDKTR